jgi:hypothetical protein
MRVDLEASEFKMIHAAYEETNEELKPQFEATKASVRVHMNAIRDVLSSGASAPGQ